MDEQQIIKDIIYVSRNWEWKREKAQEKLHALIEIFPKCQVCHKGSGNVFLVIEESYSGWLVKKCQNEVFSVCSLKCLFDRGLNRKAYYSVVVRLASGEVCCAGFFGQNAMAISEFADKIKGR